MVEYEIKERENQLAIASGMYPAIHVINNDDSTMLSRIFATFDGIFVYPCP